MLIRLVRKWIMPLKYNYLVAMS